MSALLQAAVAFFAITAVGWLASRTQRDPRLGGRLGLGVSVFVLTIFGIAIARGEFLARAPFSDESVECMNSLIC